MLWLLTMNKIITTLVMLLGVVCAYAQNEAYVDPIYGDAPSKEETKKSTATDSIAKVNDNHVIYVEVPKKLNIKDLST